MTKTEFFKLCDTCDPKYGPRVTWRFIYREHERAVFLEGAWHKSSISSYQLYRPTPGRQHVGMYHAANMKCEAVALKFDRWLDEWKSNRRLDLKLSDD